MFSFYSTFGEYDLAEWTKGEGLGVATWFRSRNQIGHFESLTYMHKSTYQIINLEFGYGLGKC